jgi:hypothetical protein
MPRPKKQSTSTGSQGARSSEVSGGQASYVLGRLLKERRISQVDINRYVTEMGREISELERRLQELRAAHGGKIAAVAAAATVAGAAAITMARRRPGRPPGSGRKPGRPAGTGKKRGRPAGTGAASTGSGSTGTGSGETSTGTGTGGAKAAKRGRKASAAITAGQLASRQLQGRYLSLVRQFPENRRAGFARTAKEKGREAAIREMQDSLKK